MEIKLKIGNYNYNNSYVLSLSKLIENNFTDLLHGAYIHGSLATGENNAYSDFDAIAIIDDEKVTNIEKKVLKFLRTEKIFYKFDPFQHHGWFIIKKSQLLNYPQTYFPFELWQYSKSILRNAGVEININISEDIDYHIPFKIMQNNLLNTVNGHLPRNLYQLKSFLSGLMLIPSLYLQAKNKVGVYKKFSFDLAKCDFEKDIWTAMETANYIRINWEYKLNYIQRFVMTKRYALFRKLTKYYLAPEIPEKFKILLNETFYSNCKKILDEMEINLQK